MKTVSKSICAGLLLAFSLSASAADGELEVTGNTFLATSSGNVGIATTSPLSNKGLTVGGSNKGANYFQNAQVGWRDAFRIYRANLGKAAIGLDSQASKLQFAVGSGTVSDTSTKMTIDSAGKVGIGTANPTAPLEVDSQETSRGNKMVALFHKGDKGGEPTAGSAFIRISSSAQNYINHVELEANSGYSGPHRFGSIWGDANLVSHSYGQNRPYGSINFVTADSSGNKAIRMVVGASSTAGNVGIGTNNPTEKLEVAGTIKATDINFSGLPTSPEGLVTGDVWSDNGTLKIVQ